ncbi:hypothetical protein IID10_07395 [candidate division KSB1 bacterium]|nr:hypothetical protein [candidate division KSB1 bacterium]
MSIKMFNDKCVINYLLIFFSLIVVNTAVSITDLDGEPSSGIKEVRVRSTVAAVKFVHSNGTLELPLGLDITIDAGGWIKLEWNGTLWSYKGHENQEGEEGI